MKLFNFLILVSVLTAGPSLRADELCPKPTADDTTSGLVKSVMEPVKRITDTQVYSTLDEAVAAEKTLHKPKHEFTTLDKKNFPSYSDCERSFFRVVTVDVDREKTINTEGWKSGYDRGESGNAMPPTVPFSERIIQYVGVKGEKKPFPRNSTIVGVMEDPVRTLSVGWHTGYTTDPNKYMRMDEIEIGSCAQATECKTVQFADSSKVFEEESKKAEANGKMARTPRYSTEGEWAVDRFVPPTCIKATYRVKYQKINDGSSYSGSY